MTLYSNFPDKISNFHHLSVPTVLSQDIFNIERPHNFYLIEFFQTNDDPSAISCSLFASFDRRSRSRSRSWDFCVSSMRSKQLVRNYGVARHLAQQEKETYF